MYFFLNFFSARLKRFDPVRFGACQLSSPLAILRLSKFEHEDNLSAISLNGENPEETASVYHIL